MLCTFSSLISRNFIILALEISRGVSSARLSQYRGCNTALVDNQYSYSMYNMHSLIVSQPQLTSLLC